MFNPRHGYLSLGKVRSVIGNNDFIENRADHSGSVIISEPVAQEVVLGGIH